VATDHGAPPSQVTLKHRPWGSGAGFIAIDPSSRARPVIGPFGALLYSCQ